MALTIGIGIVTYNRLSSVTRVMPILVYAHIGPTREWGYPEDEELKDCYPGYSLDVWEIDEARNADLCLIDGRFRVACFLNTMLRCRGDVIIMFHDYRDRTVYHIVSRFADEVARVNDLSVFRPRKTYDADDLRSVIEKFQFSPG
jgi:hypothetical protein